MKVWIVCVLLCAAITPRTAAAAAIETGPEQDQKRPEETTGLAVEELVDAVEEKEGALKADDAAKVEEKEGALKADDAAKVKFNFCPHGWIKYESRCFRLMRPSQSWINAEAKCATEQARLASIRNIGEHNFLQNLLEMAGLSQAWIGAYYFQGSWLWVDTARFYYSNWHSLSSVSSFPCAFIRNNAGWSNTNCGSGYAYFCSIDLNMCY